MLTKTTTFSYTMICIAKLNAAGPRKKMQLAINKGVAQHFTSAKKLSHKSAFNGSGHTPQT